MNFLAEVKMVHFSPFSTFFQSRNFGYAPLKRQKLTKNALIFAFGRKPSTYSKPYSMTNYLLVPGLGNSGPEHWQTYFQNSGDNFFRIEQQAWDAPTCEDWITTIDKRVSDFDFSTVVLIGHSLGCSAIAHWATKYKRQIKGALLVAPSDLEAPQYTFPATGFAPIPLDKINFKTIVVASANDIWVSLERAKFFAENWGSEFINIGNAGHINVASGHTNWDEGMAILKTLG